METQYIMRPHYCEQISIPSWFCISYACLLNSKKIDARFCLFIYNTHEPTVNFSNKISCRVCQNMSFAWSEESVHIGFKQRNRVKDYKSLSNWAFPHDKLWCVTYDYEAWWIIVKLFVSRALQEKRLNRPYASRMRELISRYQRTFYSWTDSLLFCNLTICHLFFFRIRYWNITESCMLVQDLPNNVVCCKH